MMSLVMLIAGLLLQGYVAPAMPTSADLTPLVVIFVLIVAAAGLTRGADIFAFLGIGTLMGMGQSASSTGGSGKGLRAGRAVTSGSTGAPGIAGSIGTIGALGASAGSVASYGAASGAAYNRAKNKIAERKQSKANALNSMNAALANASGKGGGAGGGATGAGAEGGVGRGPASGSSVRMAVSRAAQDKAKGRLKSALARKKALADEMSTRKAAFEAKYGAGADVSSARGRFIPFSTARQYAKSQGSYENARRNVTYLALMSTGNAAEAKAFKARHIDVGKTDIYIGSRKMPHIGLIGGLYGPGRRMAMFAMSYSGISKETQQRLLRPKQSLDTAARNLNATASGRAYRQKTKDRNAEIKENVAVLKPVPVKNSGFGRYKPATFETFSTKRLKAKAKGVHRTGYSKKGRQVDAYNDALAHWNSLKGEAAGQRVGRGNEPGSAGSGAAPRVSRAQLAQAGNGYDVRTRYEAAVNIKETAKSAAARLGMVVPTSEWGMVGAYAKGYFTPGIRQQPDERGKEAVASRRYAPSEGRARELLGLKPDSAPSAADVESAYRAKMGELDRQLKATNGMPNSERKKKVENLREQASELRHARETLLNSRIATDTQISNRFNPPERSAVGGAMSAISGRDVPFRKQDIDASFAQRQQEIDVKFKPQYAELEKQKGNIPLKEYEDKKGKIDAQYNAEVEELASARATLLEYTYQQKYVEQWLKDGENAGLGAGTPPPPPGRGGPGTPTPPPPPGGGSGAGGKGGASQSGGPGGAPQDGKSSAEAENIQKGTQEADKKAKGSKEEAVTVEESELRNLAEELEKKRREEQERLAQEAKEAQTKAKKKVDESQQDGDQK